MAFNTSEGETVKPSRYSHLSEVHPEWNKLASHHAEIDKLADAMYKIPIADFRKIPYRPAPLPANAPVPGRDVMITSREVVVRDGQKVGLRVYTPLSHSKDRALFFNIHGGGWTVGNPETEEAQNRFVTAQTKAVTVSVDYRKAPENPFPYALNDSFDALIWCVNNAATLGVDSKKIVIGGGSAGANISAAIAQMAREEFIPGIIGQVLNIPVICHPAHFPASKYEYHSYQQNEHAPVVSASRMKLYWDYYLPNAEADPRASPLLATSFSGLAPALIQIAGMDPLRDEGLAYAEALEDAGIDVTLKVYPGLPHAFYIYPDIPPTREYFQTIVDWIIKITSHSEEDQASLS